MVVGGCGGGGGSRKLDSMRTRGSMYPNSRYFGPKVPI